MGDTVTLGGADFPILSQTRTYSFAASVLDTSGVVPLTAATATAYGSVEKVPFEASLVPGSGYTMPTVDFDMPDDPNGVQAKAHAVWELDCDAGRRSPAIVVDNPGSGYSTAPECRHP